MTLRWHWWRQLETLIRCCCLGLGDLRGEQVACYDTHAFYPNLNCIYSQQSCQLCLSFELLHPDSQQLSPYIIPPEEIYEICCRSPSVSTPSSLGLGKVSRGVPLSAWSHSQAHLLLSTDSEGLLQWRLSASLRLTLDFGQGILQIRTCHVTPFDSLPSIICPSLVFVPVAC